MNRYAIVDFETTGFSPKNGARVIEIGVVMVEDWRIVDTYDNLINPGVPVPGDIEALTGITNNMIRNALPPQRIFQEAYQFVSGATLVAHNAVFEKQFWLPELSRLGLANNHQFLCTKLISRRLYPWLKDYRLSTLVEAHNIKRVGADHRALPDALVTSVLFLKMCEYIIKLYPGKKITPVFLKHYQKMRKSDAESYPKRLVLDKGSSQTKHVEPTWVPPATIQKPPVINNDRNQKETEETKINKPVPEIMWLYLAIISALMLCLAFA